MKKLVIALLLLASWTTNFTYAQECMGVALKVGGGFEMITYDGRGKESGRLTYVIKNISKQGADTKIDMEFESMDKKGKSEMKTTYTMLCNGNELRVDANAFLGEEQRKSFQSFEMTFTSKDIVYPGNLSVGQKLPDGSLSGEGATGPMAIEVDMVMNNRKVEAKEKITVPAGTFDTHKITSDMNVSTKTIMKMAFDFQTVSYRANGVLWDVKTETYRKGKLISSTVLSKLF
ncbi:TapB family protein [Arundinibacter roseus]|uniref:DUF3108 domain-containing protein n=1 Tax=Arundinibacter roseus TaxID=2070510 RepID=A0A4R4KI97_9BACT|nr:hypothetical protein [Arundinibacter roseus]TDB67880.1 hypothetical protein EZE20_02850 [Arundinibacter roseus]